MRPFLFIIILLLPLLTACDFTYNPYTINVSGKNTVYEVKPGDSVAKIAQKLQVSQESLITKNNLEPPYIIIIGQKLKVPFPEEQQNRLAAASCPPGQVMNIAIGGCVVVAPPPSQSAPAPLPADTNNNNNNNSGIIVSPLSPLANIPTPPVVEIAPEVIKADLPAQEKPVTHNPAPRSKSGFVRPAQGEIIAKFGPQKGGHNNDGINIKGTEGSPIKAAENGVVVYAGNEIQGFGELLLVKHDGGWITTYAHNQQLLVKRGDAVVQGQTIATMGKTGNVTSPQLHFEIRKGTKAVNPEEYM